eukprot:756035-Hanusia_phi.AAC.3
MALLRGEQRTVDVGVGLLEGEEQGPDHDLVSLHQSADVSTSPQLREGSQRHLDVVLRLRDVPWLPLDAAHAALL